MGKKTLSKAEYDCWRKKTIKNERKAKERADRYEERSGVPYDYYDCPVCGWYHVGKSNRTWRK